ncbi:unnamed protein product [Ectocarpus fasciculatus]
MLHAEEGLWLVERGMLAVHPLSTAPKKPHDSTATASPEAPSSGIERNDDARKIHDETNTSNSTPGMVQEMRLIEGEEKENEGGGQDGLTGDVGSSAGKNAGPIPPRVELSSSESGVPLTGEPQHSLHPVASGEVARTGQGDGCQGVLPTAAKGGRQKAGCKRSRPGQGRGERVMRPAPAMSVSVGKLHEMVLSRAGVPWECYRAYAELKRRSYVVRRQPEDTVGHDDNAPRAAPLSWFQGTGATKTSNSNPTTPASYTSSPSSSLPVTFHVYNNPSGSSSSSSFRKRDPGPPDALLVVCRFGDPMPQHRSLVALVELHANMRMKMSMSQQRRRRGREDRAAGVVSDLGPHEAAPDRDSGSQDVPTSGLESDRGTSSGGQESGGGLLDEDRRKRQAGTMPDKKKGLDEGRTRGRLTTEGSGGSALALSDGVERLSTPGIKVAVVSGEAQVQLFDVGLHDAHEAVELPS